MKTSLYNATVESLALKLACLRHSASRWLFESSMEDVGERERDGGGWGETERGLMWWSDWRGCFTFTFSAVLCVWVGHRLLQHYGGGQEGERAGEAVCDAKMQLERIWPKCGVLLLNLNLYFDKTIPTQDPLTRFYQSFKQCHMGFKSLGSVPYLQKKLIQ